MSRLVIILFLFTSTLYCSQKFLNSSEKEFRSGNEMTTQEKFKKNTFFLTKEEGVYYNGRLILKNSLEDENFTKYLYLGEIINKPLFEEQSYNGSNYFFLNLKNKKQIDIGGKPFYWRNYLITVNEETTTDNKEYITIWHIKNTIKRILKIKYAFYHIIDMRINENKGLLFIKNSNNEYKKIKLPALRNF